MRKILIVLLFVSLVMTACDGKGPKGSIENTWIGGTKGVIVSFEENAPQAEVFDGGNYPFGVVTKLKNEGEYEVQKEDVKVTISGILAQEFGRVESDLVKGPDDLLPAKRKDSEGRAEDSDPVFVDFGDFTFESSIVAQNTYTLRADVCYKYQTTANSLICVLKDNLKDNYAVCAVNEPKAVFNSGAPVQISDFRESARGKNKIAFTFIVSHKGAGKIFKMDSGCNVTSRDFEDRVFVDVSTGIEGKLECTGLKESTMTNGSVSGFLTLFSSQKAVSCSQEVSTNSDYQKPATIKATYDYSDNIVTEVLVKHQLN